MRRQHFTLGVSGKGSWNPPLPPSCNFINLGAFQFHSVREALLRHPNYSAPPAVSNIIHFCSPPKIDGGSCRSWVLFSIIRKHYMWPLTLELRFGFYLCILSEGTKPIFKQWNSYFLSKTKCLMLYFPFCFAAALILPFYSPSKLYFSWNNSCWFCNKDENILHLPLEVKAVLRWTFSKRHC